MTENKKELAEKFLVRVVPAADRPSGVVLLMFSDAGQDVDRLSDKLSYAGYDSYICRVGQAELLMCDADIEDVVDSVFYLIREKYRYLPVFAVGSRGGSVALMASKTSLCGIVLTSLPSFSQDGEKLLKKLKGHSLFKKAGGVYPKLTDEFDSVFGEPFGKLPADTAYAGLRILGNDLLSAFGNLPSQSVPVLVLSEKGDEYGKRYAETLSDNDHSRVEHKSYDVSRNDLFSDENAINDIIGFINESAAGYLDSLSQNFGGIR